MTPIRLTSRALSDIDEVEGYSIKTWGERVADRHLADLEDALQRIEENISLLKASPDYPGRLRFYRLREHVLVGDIINGVGFVLAAWHGSMDFLDRLPKLEPDLLHEAEFIARQVECRED